MTDTDDTISVEGLGEPPPELHEQLAEPPAADETAGIRDVSDAERRALMVESLTAAIQAPFAIVAARRGPHWRVDPDEARSVAEPLALVIPASALAERLVNASPWVAAGSQLYALVQVRLAADAAAQAEQEGTDAPRRPRPLRAVPDLQPREAGGPAGPPGPRVRPEPQADGTGDGGEPFTGAGLGLGSPGLGERPAGNGE